MHARFETALGRCQISWTERGIRGVALPGQREKPAGALPPPRVERAIAAIAAALADEPVDLRAIELDLEGVNGFDRRVAAVARTIPCGETLTYGEVACRIGAAEEAREVGRALARNRFPIIVPCHRVVAAGGRLGGFSAPGGVETKLRLLAIERRHAPGPLTLFDGT